MVVTAGPAAVSAVRADGAARTPVRVRALQAAFVVALLAGAALRLLYVNHPFDDRSSNFWHEADYTQIARNFYREGLNILYPRIDWRGDTPGYVEMEFPLLPWVAGALYRVLGDHEVLMRWLSAGISIATLLLFARLSRRILPADGALLATAVFSVNPWLTILGASMQAEPLMLLFCVWAMDRLYGWYGNGRLGTLLVAAAALALAILAKMPAACLGVVFAGVVLARCGKAALRDWRVYLAGAVAVLPPLLWYAWAHHLWSAYGNSLGVSNETHATTADILWPPHFVLGNLRAEFEVVFPHAGCVLALLALRSPWTWLWPGLTWYAATWLFYLAAGNTTGDEWATYYHCLSVPAGCLLMGAGVARVGSAGQLAPLWKWPGARERWLTAGLALLAMGGLLYHMRSTAASMRSPEMTALYHCAADFAPLVPPGGQIVTAGGAERNQRGQVVAHNESMLFAWMDRRGFNYSNESLSAATLEAIAGRGGRFWIARQNETQRDDVREAIGQGAFRAIAESGGQFQLIDLRPGGP